MLLVSRLVLFATIERVPVDFRSLFFDRLGGREISTLIEFHSESFAFVLSIDIKLMFVS